MDQLVFTTLAQPPTPSHPVAVMCDRRRSLYRDRPEAMTMMVMGRRMVKGFRATRLSSAATLSCNADAPRVYRKRTLS
eukprot:366379-Chlamydomonas_euryale.AAC.12